MLVTKIFNVESAHIVRNCTSERCSHSIHGHSAVIEVTLKSNFLDNAQMVMDFGLMKNEIKKFVDSMDHCYLLCSKDNEEFKTFIKRSCDRWIELPFNPSAEMLSMFVFFGVYCIISNMQMNNGEKDVEVYSVKYHETKTGSATCFADDLKNIWNRLADADDFEIHYSDKVIEEWNSPVMGRIFRDFKNVAIINPTIKQQIKL